MANDSSALPDRPGSAALRKYEFLDGLRGLAAFYVVLNHLYLATVRHASEAPALDWFWRVAPALSLGRFAVDVFIVLSGFCLMMPVVRSGDGRLRGGTMLYLKRRSKRILPPYYAALGLSLLVPLLVPAVGGLSTEAWNPHGGPMVTAKGVLTHLVLVHDLIPSERFTINAALWSVALEWQIYFLLPLLLLPVWRRAGLIAVLAVGVAGGVALPILLGNWALLVNFALFVFGMAAADLCVSRRPEVRTVASAVPWGAIALAGAAVLGALLGWHLKWEDQYRVLVDAAVGVITCCALVTWVRSLDTPDVRSAAYLSRSLLECRPLLFLGVFSYSIYLIHMPLIVCLQTFVRHRQVTATRETVLLFASIPLIVGMCFVFHYLFERPTLARGREAATPLAPPVVLATLEQPAP